MRPAEDEEDASSTRADLGPVPVVPFETVYRSHNPALFRYCLARLADPGAAEDATADAFMKAFSAYERVRPEADSVRLWLFRIAGNVVRDHYRRRRRGSRLFAALVGSVPVGPDPEAQAMLSVELQGVLDALAHLPSRERQLVGLRAGAGLPYGEIAALLKMNENSARVATHRALQRLRARVGEH